jgi:hypothetical protein
VRRGGRSEIAPPWCATLCVSTLGDWTSAIRRNATAKVTPHNQSRGMSRTIGNRRPCGRKNSSRRRAPLPVCCARQEKTGGGAYSRQRRSLFVHSHGRTHNHDDSRRAVGGALEGGRWYEDPLRSELAQRGHCLAGPAGEARSPTKLHANARGLCCVALRPRLRCKPTLSRKVVSQ